MKGRQEMSLVVFFFQIFFLWKDDKIFLIGHIPCGGGWHKKPVAPLANAYGHTYLNTPEPVPLSEVKQVTVRVVVGRVTTCEFRML